MWQGHVEHKVLAILGINGNHFFSWHADIMVRYFSSLNVYLWQGSVRAKKLLKATAQQKPFPLSCRVLVAYQQQPARRNTAHGPGMLLQAHVSASDVPACSSATCNLMALVIPKPGWELVLALSGVWGDQSSHLFMKPRPTLIILLELMISTSCLACLLDPQAPDLPFQVFFHINTMSPISPRTAGSCWEVYNTQLDNKPRAL